MRSAPNWFWAPRFQGSREPRTRVRSASDVGQGIDLTAVVQHFEVHVRTGRAAGGSHESDRVTALDGLPDADQGLLVVGVTGDVTVAVIDLDEFAKTGTLARPGDDAGGHGDDPGAGRARKIHALVERLAPVEGVRTLTEVGGNKAARNRTAFRMNLLFQIACENDVLECRQLRLAQVHALLELAQHESEVRNLRADAFAVSLRPAAGRIAVEIEFAAVDIRHFGEPLTERIEADDMRVHFAQAHRHGIDAQLQLLFELRNLHLLVAQQAAEARSLAQRGPGGRAAAPLQPEGKGSTQHDQGKPGD